MVEKITKLDENLYFSSEEQLKTYNDSMKFLFSMGEAISDNDDRNTFFDMITNVHKVFALERLKHNIGQYTNQKITTENNQITTQFELDTDLFWEHYQEMIKFK